MLKYINHLNYLLIVILLISCTGPAEQLTCPAFPNAQDWGPVADMNGQSSVDIELSRLYVVERVRNMLEGSQSGESGAYVRTIDLKEIIGDNNNPISVLQIKIEPWLRGQTGTPTSLQRFYLLTLKITPHLINSNNEPEQELRKQLLCPNNSPNCATDQGALLTFDLQELYNISFSRQVCSTPDLIDLSIVPEIYNSIRNQEPLRLPTDSISSVLTSAGGSTVNMTDVTVSADGFLKIGLQFDQGGTHSFDRHTMLLSRYPDSDWFVDIDTSILSAIVRARMQSSLDSQVPGNTITSFSTSFTPGMIQANGTADIPIPGICGSSTTVTIEARNPTQLCKDADGNSAIVSWTDSTDTSHNFCVNFKKFWDSIDINNGYVSGPPIIWPTLAVVTFPVGDNDIFYGTNLDLDNAFGIIGRSSLMDGIVAANGNTRPDLPASCPGVP